MAIAQSLDHFVVPVDDLVVAEDFYSQVFGGMLGKRNGLNVRQRKRGAVPHTFIQIGGKRIGVFLQSDERPPPNGPRGLPTYSFTTTELGLKEGSAELKQLGVNCAGPVGHSHPFAEQTLFFTDPAGNHYAVYTPKDGSAPSNPAAGRMTGVGYIELEAPNVNASIKFYHEVFGFAVQNRSADGRQATLKMASGQTLILTEAPFASKGLVMSRKCLDRISRSTCRQRNGGKRSNTWLSSASKMATAALPRNRELTVAAPTWTIRPATSFSSSPTPWGKRNK